jgi:hypothetical protein
VVSEELLANSHWDHNVITPGTGFMERVSNMLKGYIADSLCNDLLWKDLKIIFSDSNVPMEGEHKILAHIRLQRLQPNYNPNTMFVNKTLHLRCRRRLDNAGFVNARAELLHHQREFGGLEGIVRRSSEGVRRKQKAPYRQSTTTIRTS